MIHKVKVYEKDKLEMAYKPYKNITNSFRRAVIERKSKIEERNWLKHEGQVYKIGETYTNKVKLRANRGDEELPIAEWLQKELGGGVFINPETKSFKTSDYMYRNQKWELKTKKGIDPFSVFHKIGDGKGQANNFIIDFTHSPLTYEEILKQVDYAFNNKEINWFKKLVIKQGERYDIFIRK